VPIKGTPGDLRTIDLVIKIIIPLLLPVACAAMFSGCSNRPLTAEEKMEDFRYMFNTIRDNYPFLWVKARTDGFDWVAHEEEFEEWAREAEDDRAFAKAINRMLLLLDNGHTRICTGRSVTGYNRLGAEYKPWKEEAAKTTPERADYWAKLAGVEPSSTMLPATEPFFARYSKGKYIVVDVAPEQGLSEIIPVGSTVLEVDGQPVDQYVRSFHGKMVLKYDPLRNKLYLPFLTLQSEAQAGGNATVELMKPEGDTIEVQVPRKVKPWNPRYTWPPGFQESRGLKTTPTPGSTAAQGWKTRNLYATVINDSVGYIQIRQMLQNPDEDMKVVRDFMQSAKSLPYLIIDIRGNQGGSDMYWMTLISLLAEKEVSSPFHITWRSGSFIRKFVEAKGLSRIRWVPKDKILERAGEENKDHIPPEILTSDFEEPGSLTYTIEPKESLAYSGKVFLLVDDSVFSSAESFAAFCKGSGWATLVGSVTGGDGIGFDPAFLTLPNSGMVIRFSSVMGLNPDWSANEETHTTPHIIAEMTPEDFIKYAATGSQPKVPDPRWDPALRECLRLADRRK